MSQSVTLVIPAENSGSRRTRSRPPEGWRPAGHAGGHAARTVPHVPAEPLPGVTAHGVSSGAEHMQGHPASDGREHIPEQELWAPPERCGFLVDTRPSLTGLPCPGAPRPACPALPGRATGPSGRCPGPPRTPGGPGASQSGLGRGPGSPDPWVLRSCAHETLARKAERPWSRTGGPRRVVRPGAWQA